MLFLFFKKVLPDPGMGGSIFDASSNDFGVVSRRWSHQLHGGVFVPCLVINGSVDRGRMNTEIN